MEASNVNPTQRTRSLADRAEIIGVIHAYARGIDTRDDGLVLACFQEDGTIQVSGGSVIPAKSFLANRQGGAGLVMTLHHMSNFIVQVEGESAVGESYMLGYHLLGPEGVPRLAMFPGTGKAYGVMVGGRYVDRFERRGGDWRIAHRHLGFEWATAVDGHLDRPQGQSVPDENPSRDAPCSRRTESAAARLTQEDPMSPLSDETATRVARLADHADITDVIHAYAHGIDRRDEALVLACFHADATLQLAEGAVVPAAEFIRDRRSGGTQRISMHHISNIAVEIDGDCARVQCYRLAYHLIGPEGLTRIPYFPARGTEYGAFTAGRYLDRFERRQGQWRIAHRHIVVDWTANVDPPASPAALGSIPAAAEPRFTLGPFGAHRS